MANSSSAFSGNNILGDKVNDHFSFNDHDDLKLGDDFYDSSKRTLSHLTIKQIKKAPQQLVANDDTEKILIIDGKTVNQVLIFGTVIDIDRQTTHTLLTVSDYTSTIKVKVWTSNDDEIDGGINDKLDKLQFSLLSLCVL